MNKTIVSLSWAVVAHTFLSQHLGGRIRLISESEPSLVYRANTRTSKATWRNPISKYQKKNLKTQNTAVLKRGLCNVLLAYDNSW